MFMLGLISFYKLLFLQKITAVCSTYQNYLLEFIKREREKNKMEINLSGREEHAEIEIQKERVTT